LFQTSDTIAAGNYTLVLNGEAGSVTASTNLSAILQASAPGFSINHGVFSELGVPIGSSGQMQINTVSGQPGDYEIQLSLSGLPSGTTATINPATVTLGQSAIVTVTASSTAPESQNTTVTVTGTPEAPAPPASTNVLVDVTPPPGSLPNNRTDYISTEDTPYAAVYDPIHQSIFASNNSWNRIDVISAATHTIQTRIPIRAPAGIDITQDNSTVWVATGSRNLYAINTATLAVTHYLASAGSLGDWQGSQLFALSDGTLMIALSAYYQGTSGIAIWNPASNAINFPALPTGQFYTYSLRRSGNGGRVYFLDSTTAGQNFYYNVSSKHFSDPVTNGGAAIDGAVNVDSTRVYMCDANGPNMYDGNFNLVGPLPACGLPEPPFFEGGSIFSTDNRYLYQEALGNIPWIIKVDASTLNVLTLAPAMPMIPVGAELGPPFQLPSPIAVDNTGLVIGIEDWGIAFDDAAFAQNYSPSQPGTPVFLQHMSPYFGPASGGTTSGGFGNSFSITPDVWYGANRGTAQTPAALQITSPPPTALGPVNVKMLFPDGVEVFDPLFFSYGPYLQYPLVSGAPPQGDVSAQVVGFGLPGDNVTGTLTVGASAASLVPGGPNGLPFGGTPYSNKTLSYTVPAGTPGWADMAVTTPDGSSTLPKAMFYAQSVIDYSSPDSLEAVLYDPTRDQLFLSAGDHIDVFSLTSQQFQSPLTPPAVQGSTKLFAGLALTPDGSLLLATDLADGSLAVVDPDNPGNSYAVAVSTPSGSGCAFGPIYVAGTSNNKAFVTTGALPGAGLCRSGSLYVVDLTSRTSGPPPQVPGCSMIYSGYPSYVASTQDGGKVAIGGPFDTGPNFCIYDVASGTYSSNPANLQYGVAISGDGNIAASELVLTDSSSNILGQVARPDVYYSYLEGENGPQILPNPVLNASGSLYYMAYPNFFEIVDAQHALLRMRFSLSETIANVAAPMAIDSGGRFTYLITNKGLTAIDLGEAPLSIGWLNPTSGASGAQVTIRGSGFGASTSATVNGQAASVSVTDENTLTLTVPPIAAGPGTIVLMNGDGTTYIAVGLLTIQ
jgi:hypothetical protein